MEKIKKVRLQFEVSGEYVERLKKLMEITGATTRKDLFNNALTFFEWAVRERSRGRVIASVDEKEKKYKEIEMPALLNAARSKGN